MTIKQLCASFIRALGLMKIMDRFRYHLMWLLNRPSNLKFKRDFPQVPLPPDYLMYESFQIDYHRYYLNGKKSAEWLTNLVKNHRSMNDAYILDWGCGPGRLIRHMPGLFLNATCFGTDYNGRSIRWCTDNLPDIRFTVNQLMPPLSYPNQMFDLVYGISIFTHLSEKAHFLWIDELQRIMKPGGILFLTLHGEAFTSKLTKEEKRKFESGLLVVRGRVTEGHRTYTAFHPEKWVNTWIANLNLLEHIVGHDGEQDVWIFQKPGL